MSNESIVDYWNFHYPPETKVQLTNDDGAIEETQTRSVAWLLGDGTPVVKVDGRAGGYLLERIRPVCGNCGEQFPGIVEYANLHLSADPEDYIRQLDAHRETHNNFEGWGVNWACV